MSQALNVHRGWLKAMYIYTIVGAGCVGLGILLAPEYVRLTLGLPQQERVISFGVVGSVYFSFALLSLLGLRSPLKYAPILFLQLSYKSVWMVAVIVPAVLAGNFPGYAILPVAIYATYIIGDLKAIPFSYLFASESNRNLNRRGSVSP